MKILHVVNSFDPSADVVRGVRELEKYSKHTHALYVQKEHPGYFYEFEQARGVGDESLRHRLLAWCDAILYQFAGHHDFPDAPQKPAAFRNINIYWDKDSNKFWSHPVYNARSFERYSLVASSHGGAVDFLPADKFHWLPDLLPQDYPYSPTFNAKEPCVSYVKHADELEHFEFCGKKQNLSKHPHAQLLYERRKTATVVIDNVSDGHWGLAGHEALLMGIPTVTFLHQATLSFLRDLTGSRETPFIEVGPSITEAYHAADKLLATPIRAYYLGVYSRNWAERFFNSKLLIDRYWDPFFDKLVKA